MYIHIDSVPFLEERMSAEDQFIPNYYRIEKHLRDRIKSGDLKPGDPIPPESQFAQEFGISRMTVRQALSRLVFEGLIERQRGRGSFVAEARFQHTHVFPSFEEEMQARGAKTSHKLLDKRVEPAEGKVSESLRIREGTLVIVLERQRLVDGQVVGYEIRYFPRWIGDAFTDDEIHNQSLVVAMRRIIGRVHSRLRLRVTSSVVRQREAKILDAKVGAPVLVRENTWYVDPEGPIQYGKSVYRGDRYQMDLEFTSWPQGQPAVRGGTAGGLSPATRETDRRLEGGRP
jgi:GntR family transcriptional regulator